MGEAIDATAIQFKLLNRSRGPAVWSPRAQADKRRYSDWIRARLESEQNIGWVIGRAGSVLVECGRACGVELETGERYGCRTLVVTTGTFLNGFMTGITQSTICFLQKKIRRVLKRDNIKLFAGEIGETKPLTST